MPDTAEPTTADEKKKPQPPRDPAREAVETVVFVVVLVLLLKLFVTEAFVIPTGSMAETLFGYQKWVKCPECEHEFPVNSHDEVEGRDGKRTAIVGYCCPNCRHRGLMQDINPPPQNNTGDRVLVLKPLFHIRNPRRGDVVVFKFPDKPQEKFTAQNYIKRAMGFGGETIGIYRGDLFSTRSLDYPPDILDERGEPLYPRPGDPLDLWKPQYMYSSVNQSNPRATDLFDKSRGAGFPPGFNAFEIVRKGEDQLLADMRIVWDNDKQPKSLEGKVPPRWYPAPMSQGKGPPAAFWNGDDPKQPRVFGHDHAEQHWIRYRHLAMPWSVGPQGTPVADDPHLQRDLATLAGQTPMPVDNFLGYNGGISQEGLNANIPATRDTDRLWVGDLVVECKATVAGGAELVLELSKGVNRFQAKFNDGKVTLARKGPGGEAFGNPSRPCNVKADSTHVLRFANVDCRLWVWVDGKRIDFGTEGDYQPATPKDEEDFTGADGKPDRSPEGWTQTNDIDAPASIGATGKVTVQNIKLMRDIYYTRRGHNADPAKGSLYYVQPGHYLCLGDNSAHSSDSRDWGTVPERLMLGKAVFVFWPAWPKNRIGFIK